MTLATLINTPPRAVALVVAIVAILGWLVFIVIENKRTPEVLSEQFLDAPNRKLSPDDDVFEGRRLDRFLGWGLILMAIVAIGLPIYWLAEVGRQEGSVRGFDKRAWQRGDELFLSTKAKPHAGFGCADCHGNVGQGGVAKWNLPVYNEDGTKVKENGKDKLEPVQWTAPAVNTVALRYRVPQIKAVLVYGRGANKPMPAWGVAGGGAMNDQQIEDLIAYLRHLAVENYPTAEETYLTEWNRNGHDAEKAYDKALVVAGEEYRKSKDNPASQLKEQQAVKANTGKSDGELLFNLFCARCHTKGWSYQTPNTDYAAPAKAGGGWYGPNLTGGSTVRQFPDNKDHIEYVTNGVDAGKGYGAGGVQKFDGGGMPYFANMLTEDQIKAIVEYERKL